MENQRVRLSKLLLKNALIKLLKEKPLEKITIYELCAEAQLNRVTFYKYYGSQYDLLTDIENDCFRKLEEILSDNGSDGEDCLFRMLEALLDDEEHFKVLINSLPDKDFSTKLFDLPTIRKQLDMAIPETFTEEERNELCLFFYQGGYAVIREWLTEDMFISQVPVCRAMYDSHRIPARQMSLYGRICSITIACFFP